jgi:hypothetical protein
MAKKANAAPEVSEVSEAPEVVTVTTETEATTSAAIDQPAVSDDASASSSLLEPAIEPAEASPSPADEKAEPVKGGGGFDSPFAEQKSAPTMVERIEALEARVSALEAK